MWNLITKRLNPLAFRQRETGSGIVMTWGMLLKWFSSVVFPLPMFPSTITVKGRAGFMFKELIVLAETAVGILLMPLVLGHFYIRELSVNWIW